MGEAHVEERRSPKPKAASSNLATHAILCPVCGKEVTAGDHNEPCPNTPYWHGKHAIAVLPCLQDLPEPSLEIANEVLQEILSRPFECYKFKPQEWSLEGVCCE